MNVLKDRKLLDRNLYLVTSAPISTKFHTRWAKEQSILDLRYTGCGFTAQKLRLRWHKIMKIIQRAIYATKTNVSIQSISYLKI